MRIYYNSKLKQLETNHEGFAEITQIMNTVRQYSCTKVVFDLANTQTLDGSMASVYAAMSYYLSKSNNSLSIQTKNDNRLPLFYKYDLLGSQVNWGIFLKFRFWNGGTAVRGFTREEYFRFNHYLITEAFDNQWWDISVEMKQNIKRHLRRLFKNASEHCEENAPIFISSSFKDRMLKFTLVDCGPGFYKNIAAKDGQVVNEQQAIMWALEGRSSKNRPGGKLRSLRKFCNYNLGNLLIASGYATVGISEEGEMSFGELVAPFRGSIISFAVYVPKPNLIEIAA